MTEHVCKCRECHPELFPEVPIYTPGYVDANRHHPSLHPRLVTVDGQKMDNVTEALAGDKGWAIYYPELSKGAKTCHPCTCGHGACADVKYGRVEFGPERGEKPCPQ